MIVGRSQILRAVELGALVPIETTAVTRGGAFAAAVQTACEWLYAVPEIDAMVEIDLARKNKITPLPVI